MTPEEVYRVWAPADSIWSPWVVPVPFAEIVCTNQANEKVGSELETIGAEFRVSQDLAIVIDLPGGDSIRLGMSLALRGFRPVPVIDGSPGPGPFLVSPQEPSPDELPSAETNGPAVDMREILRALCLGADFLRTLRLSESAPPAFLLDSMRMAGGRPVHPETFDNRWKVFPQDFPSARLLQERGVTRVLLIQKDRGQPQEDLSYVLLRWQEAGLKLLATDSCGDANAIPIEISPPSRYKALWYRALAILGLRRGKHGGFGAWPPSSTSG